MKKFNFTLIFVLIFTLFSISCKKPLNIFLVDDDIKLGAQFDAEIMASSEFKILDEGKYHDAYQMINEFKTKLLATGKVDYVDRFVWKVRIIDAPATINAFAVPGGYLYFYTGLIKALDNEAEFAGVMAHEMAHISQRHSTAQLTKAYGVDLLLSMLLGNTENQWIQIAGDMAAGLSSLAFSREDENQADKLAVNYTYDTEWDARGVADFFAKMDSQSKTPVFLSTHPKDEKRIERVNKEWGDLGGKQGEYFKDRYEQFVATLP